MLSRISKMSVLGIVALMLVLGLTADDAFAQAAGTYGVAVTSSPDHTTDPSGLRAAGTATSITFTLTVAERQDKGTQDPPDPPASTAAREVTITIPHEWTTRPIEDNGDTDPPADAGEVTFSDGTNTGRTVGYVSGRNLKIKIPEGAAGNGTYTVVYYNATIPHRKGDYRFPITNADVSFVQVSVYYVANGSGKVTFTSSVAKQGELKEGDVNHAYNNQYVAVSEQPLNNAVFRFEALGSMPKDSQVRVTMAGDAFMLGNRPNDDSTASVSGAGSPELARAADTVTATIKADGGIEKGSSITITIKGLKAPAVAADAAPNTAHSFTVASGVFADPVVFADVADAAFPFTTTGPSGRGTLAMATTGDPADPPSIADVANQAVQEGTNLKTLAFTIAGDASLGAGASYEIKLPSAFPAPTMAIAPIGGTVDVNVVGHTNAAKHDGGARTLSGPLRAWADQTTDSLTAAVEYRAGPISTQGRHVFGFKTSTGPHGGLMDVGGDGYPRYIDVTAKHDSGTFVVKENGQPLVRTTAEAQHDVLELVFTAAGYMPKGVVVFAVPTNADTDPVLSPALPWPRPRNDNGDSTPDVGEVTFSGKADFVINADGTITATGNAAWNMNDEIKVTYKNVKVPKGPDSAPNQPFAFTAMSRSFGTGDTENLHTKMHKIGAGRTADGSGTLAVAPDSANSNTTIDVKLTFTSQGDMPVGSAVEVTIPDGFPDLTGNVAIGQEGVAATLTSTARTMTATVANTLGNNGTLVFDITGVVTPASGGPYEYTAKSKAHPSGTLTALSSGAARITINQVTAGTVMLSTTSAEPGTFIDDNLTITFTAGAQMQSGSKVTVEIPEAFTSVRPDNNDGIDDAGEVLLTGSADLGVSGGGTTPWVLTATVNAVIESGGTLVITYKDVTVPMAEAVYTFTTMASVTADQGLLPVSVQPTLTVRKSVTAIAMVSDPDPATVFTGESITLTVSLMAGTEAGKALGDQVVMLSDGDAGGTFMPASITIADNTGEGSATYTNSTASNPTYTLTATLGDLDAVTVEATIKSKIRDLTVNGKKADIVVAAGQMLTVSAIGQAGTGTVTIKDADGNKVGLTRALDPIGEVDPDGDQQFQRDVMLPDSTVDGEYTVNVMINDQPGTISITVLNDQSPPTLSNASVLSNTDTIMNGSVLTLSVDVVAASESNPIDDDTVMADLSEVDSTRTEMLPLGKQAGTDNTYIAVYTISMDNESADGEKTVTFSAQAMIGDASTATAMVNLENDPSTLDSVMVPDDTFRPGDMVTITAMGTAGQMVKFTVTSSDGTAMPDGKAMTEGPDGTYTGTFDVVGDVHTEGMYDVTVTMNDNPAKSMTMAGSLDIGPAGYMFTLSIPAGTHAIHIPLAVNMINGEDGTIETVGDVYDALGDAVNFIITLGADGSWMSYLGDDSAGSMADAAIGDDSGLIVVMKSAATLELVGDALGTGGVSMVSIEAGNNLVGVPLDPAVDMMISDALVEGVQAIAVSNAAGDGFHRITAAGDMGDGPIEGGVGYIVVATASASIPVIGSAWENEGAAAAPAVVFSGSQTPVLHVDGGVMDEFDMLAQVPELRVTVKNLSTGASLDTVLGSEASYSATFVEFGRHAAKAGDVLEIVAHSPNPYVGVRPVPQIVVSAEEVLTSRISLPDLELYEIPSETELLANYPNPFNPETWIPYRLAKAAEVTLSIYDTNGALVRSIDVGFKPAAVYESRASAIYWDGRNNYGERVASGTYFYHLTAGEDYASTRRMVILK